MLVLSDQTSRNPPVTTIQVHLFDIWDAVMECLNLLVTDSGGFI